MLSTATYSEYTDTNPFKGKGQERIYQAKTYLKRTEVAILISCSEAGFLGENWLKSGFLGSMWGRDHPTGLGGCGPQMPGWRGGMDQATDSLQGLECMGVGDWRLRRS